MTNTNTTTTAVAGQNRAKTDYQKTLEGVLFVASKNFGFMDAEDVAVIAAADRLRQILVRCGGCRFVCAAQDVAHLSACIVAGGDYVRDISLPAIAKAKGNAENDGVCTTCGSTILLGRMRHHKTWCNGQAK